MDTRRKIVINLSLYKRLQSLAKKNKLTLSKTIEVLLESFNKIEPQMKTIEKRVKKLEQITHLE